MIEALPDLSPPAQLLPPLFLHFGLVVCLYAALTWTRLVAVRTSRRRAADYSRAAALRFSSRRASASLCASSISPIATAVCASSAGLRPGRIA